MCGVDVLYERKIPDETLIQWARAEGRMILTRDTHLIKRLRPHECFFITKDHLEDQFREFCRCFPTLLQGQRPFSRCVECNTPLSKVEKDEVKGKVWPYVYKTQENFTTCPTCGRIYWEATHVKKIREKLERLIQAQYQGS
jgi:uncharacterized protein with PIN domain